MRISWDDRPLSPEYLHVLGIEVQPVADCGKNGKADRAILRALRGDEAAWAEAIDLADKLHGPVIYDRIRASFPSLTPHDVTQAWDDSLLILLRRARSKRLKASGSLGGLLYLICWRRAADLVRRQSSRRNLGQQAEEALDSFASAVQTNPAAFDELLRHVRDEIRRLAPRQREVWEIYADLGFEVSLKELTEAVNRQLGTSVSETTIRKRLEAGRNVLRARLRRVFREWFGEWFDRRFGERFHDWLDRHFKARGPDGLDAGDEEASDGET